jgi:hypothetical protein
MLRRIQKEEARKTAVGTEGQVAQVGQVGTPA